MDANPTPFPRTMQLTPLLPYIRLPCVFCFAFQQAFAETFAVSRASFKGLPKWKRDQKKKSAGLF